MRKGFFVPITLILLVFVSVMIGVIFSVTGNHLANVSKFVDNSILENHLFNALHLSIGYVRSLSEGLTGFTGLSETSAPSWYSDFVLKLDNNTKQFVISAINLGQNNLPWKTYKIFSSTQNYFPNKTYSSEISTFLSNTKLTSVEAFAFPVNKSSYQIFIVTRIVKSSKAVYAYALLGSDPLNKYVYFSESEGDNIWYTGGTTIYGPLRTNDTIRVFYTNTSKPTFYGTLEGKKFVLWRSGGSTQTVTPSTPNSDTLLRNAANLYGNPPYRFLATQDTQDLKMKNLADQYFSKIGNFVKPLNEFKQNIGNSPEAGLKINFQCAITPGENKITIKNTQIGHTEYGWTYELSWTNNNMSNTTFFRKNPGGQVMDTISGIRFNGVVYSTGNVYIDGSYDIIYSGKMTIISDGDIRLKKRVISKTARDYLQSRGLTTASEYPKDEASIKALQDYLLQNETSYLNLVSRGNVWVWDRPKHMKLFANVYAFGKYDSNGNLISGTGSFGVYNYNSGGFQGQLLVSGSIVHAKRAPIGTFDQTTGRPITGYDRLYIHDQRNSVGLHQAIGTPVASDRVQIKFIGFSMR